MKLILTLILSVFTLFINAQTFSDFDRLEKFEINEVIPNGQSVIYGNFIQRLGFSSGGFIQEIRIKNIETQELYSFIVKPAFKSAKENTFCYILKPGTYSIYSYYWVKSTWYGSKNFNEPIFKNIDTTDNFNEKLKSGSIKEADLLPYIFTISENTLNYLGTWHFNKGLVKFTNDKQTLDEKLKDKHENVNLSDAKVILPK